MTLIVNIYSYVQNNSSVFKTTEKKFHVPNSIYFNTYKGTRSSTHSIPHEKMNFFFVFKLKIKKKIIRLFKKIAVSAFSFTNWNIYSINFKIK